jgi:adenylate cyclase
MEDRGQARLERRLAAILAADVVGYSRLIGADEEGTLERLKAVRFELVDPKIAEHNGRIVKTIGDGLLVEFASVVDALRCAVEVQRAMTARNAGMPEDRRIEYRIGITMGDIVVEDGDIFGDGVNVAARLEGLAAAGGSVSRRGCRRTPRAASTSPSRISASSSSRTLHGRCGSIEFRSPTRPLRRRRRHCPTTPRSRYCRFRI